MRATEKITVVRDGIAKKEEGLGQLAEAHVVNVVEEFLETLVPLNECPGLLNYSYQYGRRLVLDLAIVDQDIFDIHGRWYVSRHFLKSLSALKR